MTLIYHATAARPATELWLVDDDNTLVDFSGAWTFSFKIGIKGSTALLTKTSSIAGAAGSGSEPSGTPNVTVTWAAGELNLTPGTYAWQLTATLSSLPRVFEGQIQILDTID